MWPKITMEMDYIAASNLRWALENIKPSAVAMEGRLDYFFIEIFCRQLDGKIEEFEEKNRILK